MLLAFVLGRTPDLARQELESAAAILPFQWSLSSLRENVAVLKPAEGSIEHLLDETSFKSDEFQNLQVWMQKLQHRLGGTVKIVYLLERVEKGTVLGKAQSLLQKLQADSEGKRTIGVSVYGNLADPTRLGLSLKKQLRASGDGVRIVLPQGSTALSSAQLFHNKLTLETGPAAIELCVIEDWVGVTATTQDIEFYTKRDFHIPHPDPVSGMLPPKLAQMMINLVVGADDLAVYDPFCGNGRIVLEAWLMGLHAFGSDIIEKKVYAAGENLKWLTEGKGSDDVCFIADATKSETAAAFHKHWSKPYVIVGEPYLGRPLRSELHAHDIPAWQEEIVPLYRAFFEAWANVPHKPEHMLIVFPRAKVSNGTDASVYPKVVDVLNRFGYTSTVQYTYDRPDSLIRRDLVLIDYK